MLNSLTNQARSTNLRAMKSVAVAIWVPALALMLFLASVLSALGNLAGLTTIITLPLFYGVAAAIAWVLFWGHIVPELTGMEVWTGHEPLTAVVFSIVWIASLVATLVSSLK